MRAKGLWGGEPGPSSVLYHRIVCNSSFMGMFTGIVLAIKSMSAGALYTHVSTGGSLHFWHELDPGVGRQGPRVSRQLMHFASSAWALRPEPSTMFRLIRIPSTSSSVC